ncbi:hypothetical protein C7K70_17670 [Aeromonas hydrophila]|nr:hypothetical protein C7K70_17670 [Aeromonas hydrophila]
MEGDWHTSCKDTEVLHKDMCVIVTPTFRYLGPSRRDGPFFLALFMVMLRGDCLLPEVSCAVMGLVTGEFTP